MKQSHRGYKHYTGPYFPICDFDGTKVLDPYCGNDKLTEDDVIEILVCRDPRRRFISAKEATYLKTQS